MITTYDLESFAPIESDEPATVEWTGDRGPDVELRLQTVAESISAESRSHRDFSSVIAVQALAGIQTR